MQLSSSSIFFFFLNEYLHLHFAITIQNFNTIQVEHANEYLT
jgi:hypothetical protein